MNTEKLNEYIFASLVGEQAIRAWRHRQRTMETQGASHEEVIATHVTVDDINRGFSELEWLRVESLKVQQESLTALPK